MSPSEEQINVYGEQTLLIAPLLCASRSESRALRVRSPQECEGFGLYSFVSVGIFSFVNSFLLRAAGGRLETGLWRDR